MTLVRLIAEGRTVVETSHITEVSLQSVDNLVHCYLQSHQVQSLHDLPHTGRPPDAPELTAAQIVRELRRSPLRLGSRTNVWTVKTLAGHLSPCSQYTLAPWTLRRRMTHWGLVGKRPRYFSSEQHPHRAPKKGPCAAPEQCSELNATDHLWRALKDNISANFQFKSIEEHADFTENWLLSLSNRQALLKAGVLSKNFWLPSFLQYILYTH